MTTRARAEPGRAERVLVVWCPDWPLVAAGIPASVAAAVFHANRVVACTAAARAEGVKRGLRRREAQGRCPELLIEHLDPSREARVFEPVVAAVGTFTPRVEITRPGACALGVRGPSRYFGGDQALAMTIRGAVDAVLALLPGAGPAPETRARVGVADGPFTAALAARRDLTVPPGESSAFLAPLPVGLLDEPDLTDLLARLGIRTLGAFAALPAVDVEGRFGPRGASAHRRARGLDDRSLDCHVPSPDLAVQIALDPPADRVDTAAFAAKALAEELCAALTRKAMVCTCIRIEAETEHGEQLHRVWRHHRAFTPATVAERARWQLDGWLAGRDGTLPRDAHSPGSLTLLRLVPEKVVSDDGRQRGFWGGATEVDERAARGLARVQGILGPHAVVTVVLGDGRGPAERARLVPWGEPPEIGRPPPPAAPTRRQGRPVTPGKAGVRVRTSGRGPAAGEQPPWPGRVPRPSPIFVPSVLRAAKLHDATGCAVGVTSRSLPTQAPARLSIAGGRWEQILAWAGPWTADVRWWDPGCHRRLARLQVVLGDGSAHLVVLEGGRWYVEASYD